MSPSRAEYVGLYTRALREALETAAGVERATHVLSRAFATSGLPSVPEELEAFRRFTDGPLRASVDALLRPAEAEAIFELIGHVLWMATSDVQRHGDKEEPSGERSVESVPFRMPVLPPTPVPPIARAPSSPAAHETVPAPAAPPAAKEEPIDDPQTARVSPAPRPRRASVAIGRITRPDAPPTGGVVEIGPDESAQDASRRRPVVLEVLVLTLDPLLVFETDNGLAGRGRVTSINTAAELARAASAAKARLVVLVDSALPSIDLPTFAPISGSLPSGTRIILWGVDERQKARLSLMFPAAKEWIASGRAASPAEVILDL
jgi:hypothetical protein